MEKEPLILCRLQFEEIQSLSYHGRDQHGNVLSDFNIDRHVTSESLCLNFYGYLYSSLVVMQRTDAGIDHSHCHLTRKQMNIFLKVNLCSLWC